MTETPQPQDPQPTEQDASQQEANQQQPGAAGAEFDPSEPQSHLEATLLAGQQDPEKAGEVIATFLNSEIFFLSREEVTEETGDVSPLILQNPDGEPRVALFSHLGRVPEQYLSEAPYGVRVTGAAVVQNLNGAGLVLNPGHQIGFDIPAEGVEAIRSDFRPVEVDENGQPSQPEA
ncbi:SseB family protein [Zhihengliuella sp.]|uniref:SseB family protein n=1 Tax=Zhihengliuella sp. TaxID=1954483 RepID=UPI002811BEF6|nr:SseB family protein [Zhihengliuella sp.]